MHLFFLNAMVLRARGELSRCIGPESGEHFRFFENPRQLRPRRRGNSMKKDSFPEVETRSDAGHVGERCLTELLIEQRLDVLRANATRGQLVAIAPFGQVWFGSETRGGFFDRFLERQVLERVQRVVVDEDADWPLRGKQVSEPIDDLRQGMVKGVRVGSSERTMSAVVLRNFGCPPGAILKLRLFAGNQGFQSRTSRRGQRRTALYRPLNQLILEETTRSGHAVFATTEEAIREARNYVSRQS